MNSFKTTLIFTLLSFLIINKINAQVYKSQADGLNVSFFSETPVENIDATSKEGKAVINTASDSLVFKIPVRSFHFKNSLMEEHFNENYLETSKYPNAWFKGKLAAPIKWDSAATTRVNVSGILEIHGVKQPRTIDGTITVNPDKSITLISNFKVRPENHKIQIPTLVWEKIAEEILIKVKGTFISK